MPPATLEEQIAAGRAVRKRVGRRSHAHLPATAEREDPLAILQAQDAARAPELLGLRYARMAASPFGFLRGSAAVMAADLALTPTTGLVTQLCGDAHINNVETFATPERRLVFDITDFDETMRGPFEWDVKRMVASLVVAARHQGFPRETADEAVHGFVTRYRDTLRTHAAADVLDVWYASVDEHDVHAVLGDRVTDAELGQALLTTTKDVFARARRRTSKRAARRLSEQVDGRWRMREDPPVLSRRVLPADRHDLASRFLAGYRASLPTHRRALLERFTVVDVARRVVGVGSVGTRCYVILLHGRDEDDPLVLQVKEAGPSVLERHLGLGAPRPHGRRVVEGQRTMPTASDIFLGWSTAVGPDGVRRDFYVRQFRDMKGSVELDELSRAGLVAHAKLCAHLLADAHARGGQPAALAGYLGSSDGIVEALMRFAHAAADRTEHDHARLLGAIAAGELPHEPEG